MSPFQVLIFLMIFGFGLMDRDLPHHLGNENAPDSSQKENLNPKTISEEDLNSQTITKEDLNAQTINKEIPNSNQKENPYPHHSQMEDPHNLHPVYKPDHISLPNKQGDAIEQQIKPGQLPHNPQVFSGKTHTRKNSYHPNNQLHKYSEINTEKNTLVKSSDTLYAFTAALSSPTEVSQGSVVIYDNVYINEGEMYNGASGQFVCPDDGIYVFVWSIMMEDQSSSRCLTSLTIGGEEAKYGPKTTYNSGYYSGVSQMTAVVQCRRSPLTAVTVVSGINPAPTYYGYDVSFFSGYRLAPVESAVGFTVELSTDIYVSPGVRIRFDKVISNFGAQYNDQHGYFKCPDSGIYAFTISASFPEFENQWSVSKLVFDGETVLQGPITHWATEADDSGSSSVTAVLQCQQGKDIYVEAKEAYTFPYNVYGARLTSFSGARLCSTDCDDYVAFSAILSHNVTSTGTVVFDHIIINQGAAYNPADGTFTCQDNKLYVFTWSGTAIYSDDVAMILVVDSTEKAYSFMQYTGNSSASRGTSGTTSQSTIISCSVGSTVHVYWYGSSDSTLLADYTVFSGYRVPGQ